MYVIHTLDDLAIEVKHVRSLERAELEELVKELWSRLNEHKVTTTP